jgi:uncharacterized protein YyaL (SSP411 family)
VWALEEIEGVLDPRSAEIFMAYYGVTARGNFEGQNILSVSDTPENVGERLGMRTNEVEAILAAARQTLFAVREQRVKPGRDEKILVEWNGLMIHALAECGAVLGRGDALDAAQNAARLILAQMSQPDGKLYRTSKDGRAHLNAYLEDYAAFIRGLIALYEATFELRWLAEASRLTQIMFAQFHDAQGGGFYQTGLDHEQLVVRRKDYIDNAVPSGNSLAAEALLRLAVLVGNDEYRREAARIVLLMQAAMARQPTGFGRLLCVANSLLAPGREVAIVGAPEEPATRALLAVVRGQFLPDVVVALKRPGEESMLPLLQGREPVHGQPAAYVCEHYACRLPVTTAEELAEQLTAR